MFIIWLILIPLGIVVTCYAIVAYFQFISLLISVLHTTPGWEWFSLDNLLSWIVAILGTAIVVAILKLIIHVAYLVISSTVGTLLARLVHARSKGTSFTAMSDARSAAHVGTIVTALLLQLVAIIASLFTTIKFFEFAAAHSALTDFYTADNWLAQIIVFLAIVGVFIPFSKK